ncbi:MAG TPA: hydroxyacid dehydrogenase [Planctomycetota bacterium]|nr:hydroxyacid dehydrogenase [Planctomycetota bacterium]
MSSPSARQKVLINAVVHPDAISYLEESGCDAVVLPESDQAGSLREIVSAVGLVSNASLILDDAVFRTAPLLKVVGRVGVGYDNVDVAAAARFGIRVVNTPLPVIEPVAEHTVLLMLACARKLIIGDATVRAGRWRGPETMPGPELKGKTLGLIGFGNTGRRVAEISVLGLGMNASYFDLVERLEAERTLGARRRSLDELLAESDVVSVHVNLSPATRGLMGARAFSLMKPGALFLNLSRGAVVDEEALLAALRSGHLGGAGLDVFAMEPPGASNPLLALPNVVVSPHIAGASLESRRGCSMVVQDVVRVLRGEPPVHPVG